MLIRLGYILLLIGISFFSNAQLQPPVLDSVTVINGKAFITWKPSPDLTVLSYDVYIFRNNVNVKIASINGRMNTSFLYTGSSASLNSESFTVAALSPTDTSLITSIDSMHHTIFISGKSDSCKSLIELNWNNYINWKEGIKGYDVYEFNGVNTIKIASLINQTTYTRNRPINQRNYSYFVRALSNNGRSSSSNLTTILTSFKKAPDYIYLHNASVINNGAIELSWITDSASSDLKYSLEASNNGIDYTEFTESTGNYNRDNSIEATGFSDKLNYFRIKFMASCPDTFFYSNVMQNEFITAEVLNEESNLLKWNKIQGWDGNVGGYELFRNGQSIVKLHADSLQYIDAVVNGSTELFNACYQLKAIEAAPNRFGNKDSAYSNIVCLTRELRVFTQSAISPRGPNPVFKPVLLSASANDYLLQIYSRYGGVIFESTNPDIGWDGKFDNGDYVPMGTYIFLITAKGNDGTSIDKTGIVNVIY